VAVAVLVGVVVTRLCALQPLDAALLLQTPKLQCKSEHLRGIVQT
jgi:hypothetical protein